MKPKACLSIAGSDPSGGAGIQGDLKTFSAHDVYGMAVITALTVQNTQSVESIFPVPTEIVLDQLKHLYHDIPWVAAKTGMLHSSQTIRTVGDFFRNLSSKSFLVVDPVMIASSGDDLASDDLTTAYKESLIPLATLVTPNVHEAARLTGFENSSRKDFTAMAEILIEMGAKAVLLKGGDLTDDDAHVHDLLQIAGDGPIWFKHNRVHTGNSHGTGCALAAAIASNLALGFSLLDSVDRAREYVRQALVLSYPIGRGKPSINHLWKKKTKQSGPMDVV